MLSILVVDDESPIREWLVYCIQNASEAFRVVGTAMNGKEAYDLALQLKPEVVVTDIKMPGMDGIELMREVKKHLPYTQFIILTNFADFSYARQAISYGAREYLLKSEMRGADLTAILNAIAETRESIVSSKHKDILPSGHVDLYELYRHNADRDYTAYFWIEQGMRRDKPYCLLVMEEDAQRSQHEFLLEQAKAEGAAYAATALNRGYVCLVLQEEDAGALTRRAERIAATVVRERSHSVGVGEPEVLLNAFLPALERAQATLSARFFADGEEVFLCRRLSGLQPIDKACIRTVQKETLSAISIRQYSRAEELLEEWFSLFASVGVDDIVWAIECCNRMVLSVEERFYHLNPLRDETIVSKDALCTADQCRAACRSMLGLMQSGELDGHSQTIDSAIAYIHKNYNRPLSLVEVASHIFRSPEYFCRQFKEEVGENFSVYLIMYRLNRARELLHNTDFRISQIAYEVGYSTPGYFSRLYKKYMGMTPEEERGSR